MSTETTTLTSPPQSSKNEEYTLLHLSSGNGPITRPILNTPPRDALPSEIPIIDVSDIFSPSLSSRQAVATQVHNAATNNGFFYITNHGIDASIIENAYTTCLDFFRSPLPEKEKASVKKSKYFNGYKAPQTQQLNPSEGVDHREGFSFSYDANFDTTKTASDLQNIPSHVSKFLRLEDAGFPWTQAELVIPGFQDAVIAYYRQCLRLARALARTFALSLSLPETAWDTKFTFPDATIALNYYPSLPSQNTSTRDVSIGSHTDFQLFTMLYQPPHIRALQVLSRQNQWLWAPGIDGTLVVNIADYLQRITNDTYKSTVHRAINTSGQERISMPFFFGFGLHETCGVLSSCCSEERPAKYEEISCEEWVTRRARAMHDVKGRGDDNTSSREKKP